jgi:hypothetical protein
MGSEFHTKQKCAVLCDTLFMAAEKVKRVSLRIVLELDNNIISFDFIFTVTIIVSSFDH